MPFDKRIRDLVFIENQDEIEKDWHKEFGDRKNEIVFIGQDLDEIQIRTDLSACLSTAEELNTLQWEAGYDDHLPIERVYAT